MPDTPANVAANPDPEAATAVPGGGRRRHRVAIATLFVLATLVGVLAVHAVWINRQALNTSNWVSTSSRLLANKDIQTAMAAYSVDQLFKSGAVQDEVKAALPTQLQPLAGPATAGLEQLSNRIAPRLLASPPVQTAWREANRAAHRTLLKIINGNGKLASTNGGVVTLNLHAIVAQLAAALGLQSQVAAIQSKLQSNAGTVQAGASKVGITLPPASGELVIMRSSQLKTVQDIASAIKGAAILLPLLTFAMFILAVWLSKGRRRKAVRITGWCFVVIGVVALLDRRIAGNVVIDALIKNPANKAAGHEAWAIATTLLYDIGVAMIVYGLVFVFAAWVAGETRLAVSLRRALAPTLRTRPAVAYGAVYAALFLAIVWGPTPATRQLPYIIAFIVLLAIGVHALRRQTAEEFPDAQAGDTMTRVSAFGRQLRPAAAGPASGQTGRVAELERLATLHDEGSLTDAEFVAEKSVLMNGS
jgi:sulfite exporter TauE/SafE